MLTITTILADHVQFHSGWQIETAIVGRNGTLYGCYKQAVRELYDRCISVRGHSKALAILEIDIAELQGRIVMNGGNSIAIANQPGHVRKWKIELEDKMLQWADAQAVLRSIHEEFLQMLGQAIAYRRELGVPDDQAIPIDRRDQLDREMWLHNVRAMCAMDFMTSGRLQRGTLDLVRALPRNQKAEVYSDISTQESQEALISWFLTWERPELPPIQFESIEAERILECTSKISLSPSPSGLPVEIPCSPESHSKSACESAKGAGGELEFTAR